MKPGGRVIGSHIYQLWGRQTQVSAVVVPGQKGLHHPSPHPYLPYLPGSSSLLHLWSPEVPCLSLD